MRVTGVLAGALLVLALALTAKPAQASDVSVTTELRPGWNLVGWTAGEADIDAVFSALPSLLTVYAWDADEQRFIGAYRDGPDTRDDLKTLTPGMGLFLYLAGEDRVEWTRPHVPESLRVSLVPGWNLVAWSGIDNTLLTDGLAPLGSSVGGSWLWNAETGRAEAGDRGRDRRLKRGEALWIDSARELRWRQADAPVSLEFIGEFNEEERTVATGFVEDAIDFFAHRFEVVVPTTLPFSSMPIGQPGATTGAARGLSAWAGPFLRMGDACSRCPTNTLTPYSTTSPHARLTAGGEGSGD